jgi:hypothetical protein
MRAMWVPDLETGHSRMGNIMERMKEARNAKRRVPSPEELPKEQSEEKVENEVEAEAKGYV